jgi:hypothetical protein
MISSLLLSFALAGQCGPSGCPYRPRPQQFAIPQPVVQAPAPDWGWHLIRYQGSTAWIWGYHLDPQTIYSTSTPLPIQKPDPIPQAPDPIPQAPDVIPQPPTRAQ